MEQTTTESVPKAGELTALLSDLNNPESLRAALELTYSELHDIAVHHFRRESVRLTLQPTEILNEVLLGFIADGVVFENRRYFFAAASESMRRLLVDRARRMSAKKRGRGWQRISFLEAERIGFEQPTELLDFHTALQRLETFQPKWSKVAELRVFGGLSTTEVAEVLGIGASTARKRWAFARKWLRAELSDRG